MHSVGSWLKPSKKLNFLQNKIQTKQNNTVNKKFQLDLGQGCEYLVHFYTPLDYFMLQTTYISKPVIQVALLYIIIIQQQEINEMRKLSN